VRGREWPSRRHAGAVLMLAAVALAAPLAAPVPAAAQTGVQGTIARPLESPRAFEHARHRGVGCEVCHSRDERHRARTSWTPAKCAACHHGNAPPAGCLACHDPAGLEAARTLAVPLALTVWSDVRVRDLAFEHGRHDGVACLDCHQSGMSRPPRSCAGCHTSHHDADADCTSCHPTPAPAPHGLAVHGSCAGGGCHDAAATAGVERARPACLLCHEEQREHKAGRTCVACHVLPQTSSRETS